MSMPSFYMDQHLYPSRVTGTAPAFAETNPPLQTQEPIKGARGRNIFHTMGDLSPYSSPDKGFGMHMIHRHGSRYPSGSERISAWAEGIANSTAAGNKFTDEEILGPKGREELFESGILNYYNYGHLFNQTSPKKLVVPTTSQDRMLKSAENFLAGFFGLDWSKQADLLPMIDRPNRLQQLPRWYKYLQQGSAVFASAEFTEPITTWKNVYLALLLLSDSTFAQALCSYETVSYGYSKFCQPFTYEDFEGFGYLIDLEFALGFWKNPAGRAQGIAWVEEFLARVEGRLLETTQTNANMTPATNPVTFPVDQNLYLDFSYDSGIVAALVAFGFKQFAQLLPATGPPCNQQFSTSKLVPFAGRTNIEIKAPYKVSTCRPSGSQDIAYHTLPLHSSFAECKYRDDGWCKLSTLLKLQKKSLDKSKFQYSCFGDWTSTPYALENFWNICSPCYSALLWQSIPKFSSQNGANMTLCQHYPAALNDITLSGEYLIAKSYLVGVMLKLRPGG
ncbi:histidine phosphatase superfamily [Aspergillus cavernicola]|uniref:Histidine phosphatase superfamily n=1 Tax=Aspergillus cavernicola TaxID=176166 RepID=A0ABR4I9F7_9EURO